MWDSKKMYKEDGAKTNNLPKTNTMKSCTRIHIEFENVHHLNMKSMYEFWSSTNKTSNLDNFCKQKSNKSYFSALDPM